MCRRGRGSRGVACIVPPFMLERLRGSAHARVRDAAARSAAAARAMRGKRSLLAAIPHPQPGDAGEARLRSRATPHRAVYDHGRQDRDHDGEPDDDTPGVLRRAEGEPATGDNAVDEAYEHAGHAFAFFHDLFGRDSIDGGGMRLVSAVHAGVDYANAFWDGFRLVYGDGDGVVFDRMTRSLEVVGHEFTHGVIDHTSRLAYSGEAGALNEHFADVFGSLVKQHARRQKADEADWLIGAELLLPIEGEHAGRRVALRDMLFPGSAYSDDPDLGDDPQPSHYADRYTGRLDHGGVHINSGIANRAFALAAREIGGFAWERAGLVWYRVMRDLPRRSTMRRCADECRGVSRVLFGDRSAEANAIDRAWEEVGL